ncbi:MAG TPA: hypothetical protein VIK91_06075, partial [Nannocystis sp.]
MSRSLVRALLPLVLAACAGKPAGTVTPEDGDLTVQAAEAPTAAGPASIPARPATLADAEAALAAGDAARAVALFSGFLGGEPDDTARRQAYLG